MCSARDTHFRALTPGWHLASISSQTALGPSQDLDKQTSKWEQTSQNKKERKDKCCSPTNTPSRFMYPTYETYTCKYLLDCGIYTKGALTLKWPNQGSFNIPKLMCVCAQHTWLGKVSHKIKQTEWNAYFVWYLKTSKRRHGKVTF